MGELVTKTIDCHDALFISKQNKATIQSIMENVHIQAKNGFTFANEIRYIDNDLLQEILKLGYRVKIITLPMGETGKQISWDD